MMMKKMHYLTKIFPVFLIAFSSYSQRDLSAKEAIAIALENNYQVQIAEKQTEISEINNTWGEAGAFPTVTLSVGQNNTIQDNRNNPFTFTPGIFLSQGISPNLSANWNIFSGFAVRISKQRLEQLEEQSANNAMAVIESSVQDVLKAYYAAQLQKERVDLFKKLFTISKERYQYFELKEQYSGSNSLELMQFKNQFLTDSSNLILQELSHKNALRNLTLLMNDTTIVAEELNLTDNLNIESSAVDLNTAIEEMISNNNNLKNQYISVELQRTNTEFMRSFLYPTLSFQTGFNPSWSAFKEINGTSGLEAQTNTMTYYGNLNLRYTLFNNWKNKRAVEVSKINEEIAVLSAESMEKSLTITLRNLVELYEVRSQLVEISKQNLIYAEKTFELARNRFQVGTINSIDLATIQSNYQNTMIQHYENVFNRLDTFLEIYKMTGKIGLNY